MKEKCRYCDKEIEGNEKQVKHLMLQHLISKHKDKIEIRLKK